MSLLFLDDGSPASDSSTDLFFALWDGSGHPQFDSPPVLDLVIRSYRIARGTLDDWMTWASRVGSTEPALCWPSDHRWFLASDVDPHWAGVGAAEPDIRALASDSVLHVEAADPTREYPSYGG
ncbi:hypothetical protein D9V41_13635 [Aeromicrobium phragmitis]|uniref:Uncharacterized protein n=1 Tax=Aeromicrobium phragmitis TaxID=2478914 RepID=A0A3L8PI11_9ACTN|nr:hypothetical protein [Aeromicrobium phragmitis]RLV54861.1 hypothetical protein D9V41_13635 [Aeromicrobium phragmitis]